MSVIMEIGSDMVLDIAKLKDVDPAALAKHLSNNVNEIGYRINEAAKEQLLEREVPGYEPSFAFDPDFSAKWFDRWYSALRGRLCTSSAKGSALPLLFPIAVYLYECYGFSCSKLILGCEAKTVPPLWLRNWLKQTDELSPSETTCLYDILESGRVVRCDTVYILKSRIQEIAAEKGIRSDDFFLYPGLMTQDYQMVKNFSGAVFKEEGNSYLEMKPFLGNHKMLRMLILLCVQNQVSPDFLLLQDYSEFAVTPQGRYYAPRHRKLMSLLLSVNAATRMKAVGYVFAVTARRVANGAEVPCDAQHPEKEPGRRAEEPLNVMKTMFEASGSMKSWEIDAQIIESLKPKLLDMLEQSDSPVSSASLYQVIEGHSRLVRKALIILEQEGKIKKLPRERGPAYWKVIKKPKK